MTRFDLNAGPFGAHDFVRMADEALAALDEESALALIAIAYSLFDRDPRLSRDSEAGERRGDDH